MSYDANYEQARIVLERPKDEQLDLDTPQDQKIF